MLETPRRLVAASLAVLAAFATPASALAHGVAHRHQQEHHSAAVDASSHEHDAGPVAAAQAHDAAELTPASHHHEHQHQSVDGAVTARDAWRLALPYPPPVVASQAMSWPVEPAPLPPRVDPARLARPDPDTGPPPTPRAPPLR